MHEFILSERVELVFTVFLFSSKQPRISPTVYTGIAVALALMFRMSRKCVQYHDWWVLQKTVVNMQANSIKRYHLHYGCRELDLDTETESQNIFLQSHTKNIKLKLKISTTFKYFNSPTVQFFVSLPLLIILRRKLTKIKIDKNI